MWYVTSVLQEVCDVIKEGKRRPSEASKGLHRGTIRST